jgi:cation diffusion facilitator CzcD-associated flavoprotein CzcO
MAPAARAGLIEKVAVIGAGPGGLAAAKSFFRHLSPVMRHTDTTCRYLVAETTFSEIVILEQRLNVGGVWNATPTIRTDKYFTIPQTKPSVTPNEPIQDHGAEGGGNKFEFLSPIYDNLDTNIPQMLMKYSDQAFPDGTSLFPQHDVVLEYLERYADEVRHLIRFGLQVLDVYPIMESGSREKWSITTKNIETGEVTVSIFDAVIVANGHYNDPYVPDIPEIREWNAAYPASISHSKFYRRPDDFKDKVSPPPTHIYQLLTSG